jgi:hypothetical protein
LILLGTDHLEVEFGNVWVTVGNDANADLLQFSSRVSTATETTAIQAAHPEWNRGPRRIIIPSLQKQGTAVDARVDHLNPASWVGDITVISINLKTCWAMGRAKAVTCLFEIGIKDPFDDFDSAGNIDILSPLGKLVQKDGLMLGEEDEAAEFAVSASLLFLVVSINMMSSS